MRPASVHARAAASLARRISSASAPRLKPLTPSAHAAARASAFGPIAPASSGGPPACTGGGPTAALLLGRRLSRPAAAEVGDLLVEPGVAPGERRLRRPVVVLAPADAEADGEPPAGQHVEGGELLGQHRGRCSGPTTRFTNTRTRSVSAAAAALVTSISWLWYVMRSPHEMLENGPASMPRHQSSVVERS